MPDDGLPEMQRMRGFEFPAELEISEDRFVEMNFGGTTAYDLDWPGHFYLLRQVGFDEIRSAVAVDDSMAMGADSSIRFASAEATVVVDGGEYSAVGSADELSNQVREAEYTAMVAETRAKKRAVKLAIPIVKARGDHPNPEQTGDIPATQTQDVRDETRTDPPTDTSVDVPSADDTESEWDIG